MITRYSLRDRLTIGLLLLLALIAIIIPAGCLAYILWQGSGSISWQFIFSTAEHDQFGASSGIFAQLVGSLILAIGACLLAAPLALATGLYLKLYANHRLQRICFTLLNLLQGTPPIIFGLCGLMIFVHLFQWGLSIAAGWVILAAVIAPLLVFHSISTFDRIADAATEAGRSLGLTDGQLIWRVWLPQSWPSLITAVLLAMARALSETAPIVFTATVFSGVVWPASIFSPVTTLQTHIFYLAQEGNNPATMSTAWGSATVLILTVLSCSLGTRFIQHLTEQNR